MAVDYMLKYSMLITKHRYSKNQFFESSSIILVLGKKVQNKVYVTNVYYIV